MPTVLIAVDKFKGSLTAAQVAAALSTGLRRHRPDVQITTVPIADGGDGTHDAAVAAGFTPVPVVATGPTGQVLRTAYARKGTTAVVELAHVSGLARLPEGRPAPLLATSRGTGEVVAAALADGCREVVLGIGGSASTDGGAGLLRALGARMLDRRGRDLPDGGAALADLATLDLSGIGTNGARFTIACDVDNPLTGPTGAAAVYGPQKGADAEDIRVLDQALDRWADLVAERTGSDRRQDPGAGAAGGVGFAAVSVLGAQLRSGIELVMEMVDLRQALVPADLVITGEGALDGQTLHGKAPAGVAAAASAAGIPVAAVCGRNALTRDELHQAGFLAAYQLSDLEPNQQRSMRDAAPLLQQLGERIAVEHLPARTYSLPRQRTGQRETP